VIDGDTIEVELLSDYNAQKPDGTFVKVLEANKNYRVRLIGVNCPESDEPYFQDSFMFT